jgi:hypothetical protein
MKKEYDFSKAEKNLYSSKLKNTTLQEKLDKLPGDRKNKIKQRADELILNQELKE